ncbi:MarR family winged helix-turn-helix transcriptional regulator [Occultella kanbiaonis]|uniref:MarR family winged helix-turn-helix transcriptional regulator n=1 Tax=Occultella kanbiaonis TaxID=2675754 RepID=UPI0013D39460|nr:MarR family transcriptional regulator [Occultella kanbiaonis]
MTRSGSDVAAAASGPDDPELQAAIHEVEIQFSNLFVHAKQLFRRRALGIHPDLSILGYRILGTVVREGALQQGHIAERLELDKAVASRTIKHLEDLGLVERAADPSDGRAFLVTASELGRSRYDAVSHRERAVLQARLTEWGVEDLHRFSDLLGRLMDELDLRPGE